MTTTHREIQCAAQTIFALERTLSDFQRKRDSSHSRSQELDASCGDLMQALVSLRREVDRMVESEGMIPPVNLRGCKNMGARLHKVAMVTGGLINLPKTLDVLESSWPTEVRRDTLRSDLHRWIRKHPGDWEKIAPDTYRYTRYENANEPKVDEPH